MSTTNSIPATLNDLLVKLNILSMIEKEKKINMNMGSMTFVDAGSWWGSFMRSLNGEGRKGSIVHLNQIVQQAITAMGEYQNTEFSELIVKALADAKNGIRNLAITYRTDPNMVAQIKVCVENIDLQLKSHQTLLDRIPSHPISIRDQPAFGSAGIPKAFSAPNDSPPIPMDEGEDLSISQ